MLSKGYSTNFELAKWASKLNLQLVAIIYKDELYKIPVKTGGFILNLGNTENGGTHWVALYIPKTGKYSYYMDSYGTYPPEAVKWYSKKANKKDIIFNTKQIQTLRSDFCGQYSLTFLYYMMKEKGSYQERFNKFLKMFEKNNGNNI
jgi:uncharacterized protein YfaP (DUF2135 family)